MPNPLTLTDLDSLHRLAESAARRLRRRLRLPGHEQEDLRQDLLANLLARLPAFDPARGGLLAFAATCFRHRAARLADRHRREAAARARLSLDDRLPHGEGLTLADTLAEDAGIGAWLGQPTDRFGVLERRLDLERAAGALQAEDMALCAALAPCEADAYAKAGLPRTTAFRRVREMRLRLLAAGVPSAA